MQLTFFSINYYRSITDAYKLNLLDFTVLLGKNNMGKTNIIRAINLGMDILNNMAMLHRVKRLPKRMYDWSEDFPIMLQKSQKLKNKKTTIRMDFILTASETEEFQREVHSSINGSLSIYMEIKEDNILKVSVPKKGKNASAMTNKIVGISKFICDRFGIQYIPAVRSEEDAYHSIYDLVDDELASIRDEKYQEAMDYIDRVQAECLKSLSTKVKEPLNIFLPEIKSIDLYRAYESKVVSRSFRNRVEIDIDDGVRTSLSNKGDGVKSLVTIAMLSQLSTNGNRLIIVDEPENHLHPEAVHYIDSVLKELSLNHQVLVSTHNPIFVNRNSISSNYIVDSGRVLSANKLEDVRSTLGVVCSDNLLEADYIIVVEGASDKAVITKCILEDEELKKFLDMKTLVVQDIGGTHNLKYQAYMLQQLCCNYLFLLDYDSAGKTAANELTDSLSIPNDKIRFFAKADGSSTELEDLYNPEIYRDSLAKKGVSLENNAFKNRSLKWSDKICQAMLSIGEKITKEEEDNLKKELSDNCFKSPVKNCLSSDGYTLITSILNKVKSEIRCMGN